MLKSLFSQYSQDSPEAFWEWFQENESRIWKIDRDPEKISKMVRNALDQYNTDLEFEIAFSVVDGKRQFFISDGGIDSLTPFVDRLCQAAPALEHWRVINNLKQENMPLIVEPDNRARGDAEPRFQFFNDGDKVGILLLFPEYNESTRDQFLIRGPIMLKEVLGEEDFTYRVGFIDYAGAESNLYENARPLSELRRAFEQYFNL
jgi:hypothetical protein